MRTRFAEQLERHGLLAGNRRFLVALSGGLDSVALLHLCRFGRPRLDVHAAHLDHRMRPDSASDAAWVRGLCRAWRVPLVEEAVAVPPRSETEARDVRYEFLLRAAAAVDAEVVLTAHHADDQAETVLFRLARGTGIAGLAGIPARRGSIVRPLLPFSRRQLHDYAAAAGLRWREDTTNLDLRYARNRLRHVVLPALEAVRPGATRRIAGIARRAAESEAAWRELVHDALRAAQTHRDERGFELARERLLGYHPHVRARVLRHVLHELGCRPDQAGTRAAMEFINSGGSGSTLALAGGVRIEREFDRIRLRAAATAADGAAERQLVIEGLSSGTGTLVVGGRECTVQWCIGARDGAGGAGAGFDGASAGFDAAALRFPLALRGWRPGDRIRLPYGSKKLKKLFQEHRVGRAARARVPVLHDAAGSVLWVIGVARSELARPQREQRVFTITVMDG